MKFFYIAGICLILAGCKNAPQKENIAATEAATEAETVVFYTDSEIENLSGKCIGWGMRRNPPEPPEFTPEQKAVMDKYGCIYKGADDKKYLYLTFDEGYENGQTGKILDVLKEKGVKAAFFITGDYFKREGELVERMVKEGHSVGNHTMHHPSLPEVKDVEKLEEEVLSLDRAFYEAYGEHMRYLRPPKGEYSEKTLATTKRLGYVNVFWSFAYADWDQKKSRGADYAYNKTMENLHSGCVLLLHAVSKDNADALGQIIDGARSEGYEFLSLDEYIK